MSVRTHRTHSRWSPGKVGTHRRISASAVRERPSGSAATNRAQRFVPMATRARSRDVAPIGKAPEAEHHCLRFACGCSMSRCPRVLRRSRRTPAVPVIPWQLLSIRPAFDQEQRRNPSMDGDRRMDTKRQALRALAIDRRSRRSAILFAAIGAAACMTLWLVASTPAGTSANQTPCSDRRERNSDEDHYRCRLTRGVQIQALQGDRSQGRRHVRCQEQRPPAPRLQDRRQEDQASQARPEPDHEGHVQEERLIPVPVHGQRPCRRRHEGHVPRQVTPASNQARAPGPSWRPL